MVEYSKGPIFYVHGYPMFEPYPHDKTIWIVLMELIQHIDLHPSYIYIYMQYPLVKSNITFVTNQFKNSCYIQLHIPCSLTFINSYRCYHIISPSVKKFHMNQEKYSYPLWFWVFDRFPMVSLWVIISNNFCSINNQQTRVLSNIPPQPPAERQRHSWDRHQRHPVPQGRQGRRWKARRAATQGQQARPPGSEILGGFMGYQWIT